MTLKNPFEKWEKWPRRITMAKEVKYYIVEASALPEVFIKVAETKRILSTGEATTVNEATKITGISRSAFYKYRDAVLPFQSLMTGRLITFQFRLLDEPGVLSSILSAFAQYQGNLMTINSTIPTNGVALVTISAETTRITVTLEELLHIFSEIPGVVKAEVMAG